ncbi:MAG TPA: sulfate adenylyltransferase, partial [Cyanothece sp. UBA12306]|nr:sulfate adenylyltransferase [Cyanothece sp. UBA12306]
MSTQIEGIAPHGGHLINRIATAAEREEFLGQSAHLPQITL